MTFVPRSGGRVVGAAVALLSASVLAACGTGTVNPTPSPVAGASSGGTMKIGISFDEPGIGLKSGDTYSGFDVDTATYVAKALGVPESGITWVEADPADRETLITSGQVDLVLSSYSITDERKKLIDFAGPYFQAHQDLLVRQNEEEITSPETLGNRNLCSVTGTTSSAFVRSSFKGGFKLVEKSKFSDCVAALAASEVDAVTTDDVILAGFAAEPQYKGKLRVIGRGFTDENYGVGLKKGDTALETKVNAALTQYIADGSWKASLEKNVGPSGYAIPSPPTPGS